MDYLDSKSYSVFDFIAKRINKLHGYKIFILFCKWQITNLLLISMNQGYMHFSDKHKHYKINSINSIKPKVEERKK